MSDLHQTAPVPRLRIFVVENHPDTMQSLVTYLEDLGHMVKCAGSQSEALENLARETFDVLLSDIGLPDGDGWELMERAELGPAVYCVAMSGYGSVADQSRSRAAGYRRHLLKPFNPDELDAILEEAAGERMALR